MHGERAVLAVTGLAVFAVFLDTTILFVAFSSIGESFPDTSTSTLSWVLNAYTIVFAAFLMPGGVLADRSAGGACSSSRSRCSPSRRRCAAWPRAPAC